MKSWKATSQLQNNSQNRPEYTKWN